MSRKNYYRGSRNGRGANGPAWGNNSNYRDTRESNYGYNRDNQDEYDDMDWRSGGRTGQTGYYGGNDYGTRSYGNYGTGYGGGNMRYQQDQYYNRFEREDDYRGDYYGGHHDGRGFFDRAGDRLERAGERIRDTWNDWRDQGREDRNDYRGGDHNDYDYSSRRGHEGRNFLGRAADKVKETWNDWRGHRDEDRERYFRHDDYNNPGNRHNYSNRDGYPESGYNRDRGTYEKPLTNPQRSGEGYRRREQEEWSY